MKLKSLLMATLFASAGFTAMSASAVTITRDLNVETFAVSDGDNGFNAHFGNEFTGANAGVFFVDKYFFAVASGFDSAASITEVP
ncbi:hypothetical protein [Janthinobacterium sp.]|uniref:hypothetical protein n=1 Tax=Janthinobacterium sp. TaxID=1871054 RepID=UPI00293D2D02|nr:hypothetical protein [Janthinobacterium sp.]